MTQEVQERLVALHQEKPRRSAARAARLYAAESPASLNAFAQGTTRKLLLECDAEISMGNLLGISSTTLHGRPAPIVGRE